MIIQIVKLSIGQQPSNICLTLHSEGVDPTGLQKTKQYKMTFHVCHVYEDNLIHRPLTFNMVTQLLPILAAAKVFSELRTI